MIVVKSGQRNLEQVLEIGVGVKQLGGGNSVRTQW